MSDISKLSDASAASASMQVPVYDPNNGQPRKVSLAQVLAYIQAALTSSSSGPFKLASYSVAELPSALANPAALVYVTNGNSGVACLAVSNGTSWLRVAPGAAVSAT